MQPRERQRFMSHSKDKPDAFLLHPGLAYSARNVSAGRLCVKSASDSALDDPLMPANPLLPFKLRESNCPNDAFEKFQLPKALNVDEDADDEDIAETGDDADPRSDPAVAEEFCRE